MPRTKSLAALRAEIRLLERRAQAIEVKADEKITALAALIQRHDLSLADWKRAVAYGKAHKRGGPRKGRRVPVKYADDKGNKWTGRGRAPLWLVAAEKAGRKRESFLVKGAR